MWCYSILNFYFIVILHYSLSCICTDSSSPDINRLKGETGDIKEKRQLHVEDYGSLEFLVDPEPTDMDAKKGSNRTFIVTNVTSTELNNIDREENVTSIELNEFTVAARVMDSIKGTTTPANNIISDRNFIEQTTENSVKEEEMFGYCNNYKKTKKFDLNKIADVWKLTFYTLSSTLKCFRLHIKALTAEDHKRYESMYGDYDNKVNWTNCVLEVNSNDHNNRIFVQRKHFLQKNDSNFGVLDNIIIDEERTDNTTTVLREESPDQWLVLKNLLLMRDCITGDVVVFSRVPSDPLTSDIEDALVEFGEIGPVNGTRACENFGKAWVKVGKGEIPSLI